MDSATEHRQTDEFFCDTASLEERLRDNGLLVEPAVPGQRPQAD